MSRAPAAALRRVAALLSATLVSACLFTEEPAFGPGEAVAGRDSPALAAFLAVAATYEWFPPGSGADAHLAGRPPVPFWSAGSDRPADVSVIDGPGGLILVQEPLAEPLTEGGGPVVAYYAVRIDADGAPQVCFHDTTQADPLDAAAKAFGVSLERIQSDAKAHLPPDVVVHGPPEAIRGFLRDRLLAGPLECSGPPALSDADGAAPP